MAKGTQIAFRAIKVGGRTRIIPIKLKIQPVGSAIILTSAEATRRKKEKSLGKTLTTFGNFSLTGGIISTGLGLITAGKPVSTSLKRSARFQNKRLRSKLSTAGARFRTTPIKRFRRLIKQAARIGSIKSLKRPSRIGGALIIGGIGAANFGFLTAGSGGLLRIKKSKGIKRKQGITNVLSSATQFGIFGAVLSRRGRRLKKAVIFGTAGGLFTLGSNKLFNNPLKKTSKEKG